MKNGSSPSSGSQVFVAHEGLKGFPELEMQQKSWWYWEWGTTLPILVGGWTNPFEKYARQIGHLPQVGVKIKNLWNHRLAAIWHFHDYGRRDSFLFQDFWRKRLEQLKWKSWKAFQACNIAIANLWFMIRDLDHFYIFGNYVTPSIQVCPNKGDFPYNPILRLALRPSWLDA